VDSSEGVCTSCISTVIQFYGQSDSYIQIPSGPNLQGQSFSICVWERLDSAPASSAGSGNYFFGDGTTPNPSDTDNAMWIGFYSDEFHIIFSFWNDHIIYESPTTFVGKWHHLCFTYDSVALFKTIFVDGVIATSGLGTGQLFGSGGIPPFYLGGIPQTGGAAPGARFRGALSDFYLWFGVLSASEINLLYSKGDIPTLNLQLQAFYPLNDGGAAVVDTVGGVTGTLSPDVQFTSDIIPRPCGEKPAYRVQIPPQSGQGSTTTHTRKFYLPQPSVTYNCSSQAIDYIYALCCPA